MTIFNRLLSRRSKSLDENASPSKTDAERSHVSNDGQLYPDLVPQGVELVDAAEIEAFFRALDEPIAQETHEAPAAEPSKLQAVGAGIGPAGTHK